MNQYSDVLADAEERLQRAGEELAGLQNCEKEYEATLRQLNGMLTECERKQEE